MPLPPLAVGQLQPDVALAVEASQDTTHHLPLVDLTGDCARGGEGARHPDSLRTHTDVAPVQHRHRPQHGPRRVAGVNRDPGAVVQHEARRPILARQQHRSTDRLLRGQLADDVAGVRVAAAHDRALWAGAQVDGVDVLDRPQGVLEKRSPAAILQLEPSHAFGVDARQHCTNDFAKRQSAHPCAGRRKALLGKQARAPNTEVVLVDGCCLKKQWLRCVSSVKRDPLASLHFQAQRPGASKACQNSAHHLAVAHLPDHGALLREAGADADTPGAHAEVMPNGRRDQSQERSRPAAHRSPVSAFQLQARDATLVVAQQHAMHDLLLV
mmetsp:Transcript_147072/g.472364  ORF Transcript_147072/g.472364 Transcript_147072/m.472364 type:complete len:326 (+) Transcript_147072:695-1672(+)